jgi:hypothetical protein
MVSFTPRPLYLQAEWAPEKLWTRWFTEQFPAPPGMEPQNPDRPARNPAIYQLSYHGCYVLKISCNKYQIQEDEKLFETLYEYMKVTLKTSTHYSLIYLTLTHEFIIGKYILIIKI